MWKWSFDRLYIHFAKLKSLSKRLFKRKIKRMRFDTKVFQAFVQYFSCRYWACPFRSEPIDWVLNPSPLISKAFFLQYRIIFRALNQPSGFALPWRSRDWAHALLLPCEQLIAPTTPENIFPAKPCLVQHVPLLLNLIF